MYSKQWADTIADSPINDAIAHWHENQPPREQDCATPSTMTECPRVVWFKKKKIAPPIPLGWGKAQRLLHGRVFENTIAEQLKADGKLLWHWKDFDNGQTPKKYSSEYTAWVNMKMRCYNVNDRCYKDYGGRGIKVCSEWKDSYDTFAKDMGVKPHKDYSLDRIDTDGDYEPSNCRWASPTTQARNQRPSKTNTSGVRGVYFDKATSTWRAHIKVDRVDTYLGSFKDKSDAIFARQEAEERLWKDDVPGESVKFEMGTGEKRIVGTPDLLLKINGKVLMSDAKTSMGKSFAYIPLTHSEAFKDYMWFKYQLQVEAYYMLAHKNAEWFKKNKLPLPEMCNLFSYALDDGVVRRDFTWKPTQQTASKILYYVTRWNRAYASEEMPDCTCDEFEGTPRKFCYYATKQEATRTGYKLGVECCGEELLTKEGENNG